MKTIILSLVSFAFASQAQATASNSDGFLHLWLKDGKFKNINYFHFQLDVGSVLTKSKLMDVSVHDGESFLEYRAESKDQLFTIKDKVGVGGSSFELNLKDISDMFHANYYAKDYKWQLYGPSIDSFFNVLAELDNVDDENVIDKTAPNEHGDPVYNIGGGEVVCYLDRGGNGQPVKNPPVKSCIFAER